MKDEDISVEVKLKRQVEYILESYKDSDLKYKVYSLAYEWYTKGFIEGVKNGKELSK